MEEPPKTFFCLKSEDVPRNKTVEIRLGFNSTGSLSKIHIEDTRLSPEFMKIFSDITLMFPLITRLNLIECNLKASSIYTLGNFLQNHFSITDVRLDLNPVPEQNYHVLIINTGVKHLSLRCCKIDCFGVKLIAEALIHNHEVKHHLLSLILSGNAIHDEGFIVLAQSLRTNATLQFLSVAKNMITDFGVTELAKVLQRFLLTPNEDLERKFSYIKYLQKLDKEGLLDVMSSGSLISNISPLTGDWRSSFMKKKRLRKPMRIPAPELPVIREITSPTDLTADQAFMHNLHPLIASTYEENNQKYSYGNFTLKYINLSYNWFGKIGMNALIEAAEYQQMIGPQKHGPGIMYIDTEGRYPMTDYEEAKRLHTILATRIYPESLDKRHLFQVFKTI